MNKTKQTLASDLLKSILDRPVSQMATLGPSAESGHVERSVRGEEAQEIWRQLLPAVLGKRDLKPRAGVGLGGDETL